MDIVVISINTIYNETSQTGAFRSMVFCSKFILVQRKESEEKECNENVSYFWMG